MVDSVTVTVVEGNGASVTCMAGMSVLKAVTVVGSGALASGCHGGGCGVCRIHVESGSYTTGRMSRRHITEEDEAVGFSLACRTFPSTDLVVVPAPAGAAQAGRRDPG